MADQYKRKNKVKEWLKRYLPAELIATLTAVVSASVAYKLSHSYITSGIAGTIGENVGYYGYFISKEWSEHYKKYRHHTPLRRTALVVSSASKSLLIEFGVAEALDSLLIRPFFMTTAPQHIKPYGLGIFAGKIAADVIFYSLAIAGYEFKKRKRKS